MLRSYLIIPLATWRVKFRLDVVLGKSVILAVLVISSPVFSAPRLSSVWKKDIVNPTSIATAPGSRAIYIALQRGVVLVLENERAPAKPFLNIESKVTSGGELGLLGLAFHPRFSENKKFYINYTVLRPSLVTVIAERIAGKDSERELLSFAQPYRNHNGGQLAFGPDGFLYIGTGDGGSAGDPHGNAQNLGTLLGKILRIDVDKTNGSQPYSIPKDNPLTRAGERKEIFAWGLRNPWRFSFDRETGDLFAADVGQYAWEEINLVERGGNYGWKIREGKHCFEPRLGCPTKNLMDPIFEYGRDQGYSVTGGYVYRGKKLPELKGAYVYGDFGSGKIWALRYDRKQKRVTTPEVLVTDIPVSTFGEDADGEILVGSYAGEVFRFTP